MDHRDELDTANAEISMRPPEACRWFQFRLRTLLAVVALCAVAAFAWRTLADAFPYREQRRTAALVEELGGRYETAEASAWHRRLFGGDLRNLVLVDLADIDAPERYIEAVARLPELETLVVGGEAFTDEHLGKLRGTASLRHLVLDSTSVSDEAVAALRSAQAKVEVHFSERRAMAALVPFAYMSERPADALDHLKQLVGAEHFVTCWLACCSSKVRAADLAQVRHFKRIYRLVLGFSRVGDAELSCVKGLTTLRELVIGGGPVTDEGLASVAGLSQLTKLTLNGPPIGDAGLAHLSGLTNLESLDLSGTLVSDAGLEHLIGLKRLKALDLDLTRCTKAGIERLRQALPQCRISDAGLRVQ
jgi:hypothetical protein